jgi:hypothetical protein
VLRATANNQLDSELTQTAVTNGGEGDIAVAAVSPLPP